jgi:hypothetical protein
LLVELLTLSEGGLPRLWSDYGRTNVGMPWDREGFADGNLGDAKIWASSRNFQPIDMISPTRAVKGSQPN